MTFLFGVLAIICMGLLIFALIQNKKLENKVAATNQEKDQIRIQFEAETARVYSEAQSAVADAQKIIDQQIAGLKSESDRIRQHYESEARKSQEAAEGLLAKTFKDLEPLRKYESLRNAEEEIKQSLTDAIAEAAALRKEAEELLQQARAAAVAVRAQAAQRVKELHEQADARLNQAIRDAGGIVAEAEKRAEQMAGDAYTALRDKQMLEQASTAIRNIIEGYGDRYVIPTHSLLDDLAFEFGYDAAGVALKSAREQSIRMVEQGQAATCDYVGTHRKEIAIRFVIDAFNGRVDAILSRSKHDNYGTLEQEIKDAFNLVNLNGEAFKNARVLPAYLDARLAELKWAVVVHELARKQREEQRYLKERLRDEEKARKEYEEKMRQAAKEEELKKRAVEEAEQKFANANAEQKAHYEQQLNKLRQELSEATQQKLTIAQQTKKGHVYIISNIGSFGEGVYKIGQTRRPDPQERVDELSDAGVPFDFDVHAFIESNNAPVLEHKLHKALLAMQVNKMNSRKEFFRVALSDIRREIDQLQPGQDFLVKVWTEKAVAQEYYDSVGIESDPEKKEKWLKRQQALSARQLQLDTLRLSVPNGSGTNIEMNAMQPMEA